MLKEFNGKILILGAGAVSQCFQLLLIRHIKTNFSNITIIDASNTAALMAPLINQGARFIQQKVTQQNYIETLSTWLTSGDILIDLTVNLETGDLIEWCQYSGVMYLNSSIEWWDPTGNDHSANLIDETLYVRHLAIHERARNWPTHGPTAVVEHGANPGLVSHWTKSALMSITKKIIEISQDDTRRAQLKEAVDKHDFRSLAYLTGTKVIHISERDTQISGNPKQVDQCVNTWSARGLYEEGTAPTEIGWGTHEKTMPHNAHEPFFGPRNQIFLNEMGMNVLMRSWVPSGDIVGMLIRHGEAYSLSNYFTLWNNDKALYRPTVHFVYTPSDAAIASLYELRMRNYTLQPSLRIMNDDIISGHDEVGVLLLGHDLNGWWTGSHLSIEQTRSLVGNQNATTLQVAASLLGALFWMIDNPRKGFNVPDDLPYAQILSIAEPYLGTTISMQTDWNPLKNRINAFSKFKHEQIDYTDLWQFSNFRILFS
ncbi:saccharopine dehydrogenase NADP-binding domain-containing protein [Candidatus Dependentiae bacterium]|nr:saccharopine dehydrogenase NADP-binding domain-containing protein [Candidatus Dependentiae bacterium]